MKITDDFTNEILSKINTFFGDSVDTKKLWIELSNHFPPDYFSNYFDWTNNAIKFKIEEYCAEYNIMDKKVILYLPAISDTCDWMGFRFVYIFRIILYFEIGQWICSKFKFGNKSFSPIGYLDTGNIFRNFTASIIAYELIKDDCDDVEWFNKYFASLNEDYSLCLKFIEIEKDGKQHLPGLKINEIANLIDKVITNGEVLISKDYLMEYFDGYITNNILIDPDHFEDVLTDQQKKKFRSVYKAKEFGLLDD